MRKPKHAHPVAALFPMLADEELGILASNIKAQGLLHPIVLDRDGRILDGRNRQAACVLAGVEPRYTVYKGDDPAGYALSANIARRSLSKTQSAIIAAQANDLLSKSLTGKRLAAWTGVSEALISKAVTIVRYAPIYVEPILAGRMYAWENGYSYARQQKAIALIAKKGLAGTPIEPPALDIASALEPVFEEVCDEDRMDPAESFDAMRAVGAPLTDGLSGIKCRLRELAALPVELPEDGQLGGLFGAPGYVACVRSIASSIVTDVYEIVEAVNTAYKGFSGIHAVKPPAEEVG